MVKIVNKGSELTKAVKMTENCPANKNEKGFALVLVLLILMTITVLGVGIMISTGTNSALSKNYEKSVQALNMADIGANVAYRELINSGFLKTTHTLNNAEKETGEKLLTTELQNYTVDTDGCYRWEWNSSKGYSPLWDTDVPHGFKFRIYYSTYNSFVIECEGWYGNIHRRIRGKGELETMFQFSYFASRDMGEFTRGASQEIRGKVHANGNLYVRPDGSTLRVNTSSFSATGLIVRSRDAWGRPDASGACEITKNNEDSGIWVAMDPGSPRGSEGVAMESLNPLWNNTGSGAKFLWGGVVRDKVPYKSPPPIKNLEPGGYYDTQAALHINNASHTTNAWCSQKTLYNYNEQMYQTVEEVDVKAMQLAGKFPSNGLIYCNTMTRFVNADTLYNRLAITSSATVFIKGNFNTKNKKGASVMTKHRIYLLSSAWDDNSAKKLNNKSDRPVAVTTQVNGALVDGAPTVDEYNWVDRDGDHKYDNNNATIYTDWNHKTSATFHVPASDQDPWANTDDLLENWGSKTLTKLGSTVHLEGATMAANLDNSAIQAGQLPWVRKTGYAPPTRVYMYDPDLATPSGQPPFTPLVGHITSWEPY